MLLLLVGMAGCDDGLPAPGSERVLELVSPNGAEGAALFELVGRVGRIRSPGAHTVLTRRRADTTWVLVVLASPGAVSFTALITRPGVPGARVVQVADGSNQLRALAGYRVEVRP